MEGGIFCRKKGEVLLKKDERLEMGSDTKRSTRGFLGKKVARNLYDSLDLPAFANFSS